MTAHLLQITIGPVQDFIAQARRTRDLWYGSHLLSELSRAVARSLHRDPRVVLIFPALGRETANAALIGSGSITPDAAVPSGLEPCITPFYPKDYPDKDQAGQPPVNVANIILAAVQSATDDDVKYLAEKARGDLLDFWLNDVGAPIQQDCAELIASSPKEPEKIARIWDEQLTSLIEFSAAWSGVPDGAYKTTRDRLTKALATRKNLRDFEPSAEMRGSVPKSSLDGARETVLRDDKTEQRPPHLVKKYRLGDNEQLDAVGLVKRAGGTDPEDRKKEDEHDLQFVPIVNVALAPWIVCAKQHRMEFEAAIGALRAIKPRWPRVKRRIACGSRLFNTDAEKPDDRVEGLDASIFLRSRWWPECKELEVHQPTGLQEKDKAKHQERERAWRDCVTKWGNAKIGPLLSRMSEPYPYVACLVADGDGMGAAIDALESGQAHRAFSRELAKFARKARAIVEGEAHLGSLVYSGGDDVLAFLPVTTALACADALRQKFAEIMKPALSKPDGSLKDSVTKLPTLSVGIGIGHIMESMGDLLELGRRAEKLAKGGHLKRGGKDRNALAIILDKRSGGTREWRAQWSETPSPVQRLDADRKLLAGEQPGKRLSSRKVYQIADIVLRLPEPRSAPKPDPEASPEAADELAGFRPVLLAEVKRALKRIDGGDGGLTPTDVGLDIERMTHYAPMRRAVLDWINRMLIARAFAESEPEAKTPRSGAARTEEAAA
jgi:CRISPR-associated protein Cmr2